MAENKGTKASYESKGLANGDGIVYPMGRIDCTPEQNKSNDMQQRAKREAQKD